MNEVTRSPEVIAIEINAIKYQTQAMMIQASAEIGKRLTEVKEMLPHGEWGNWLKENVEYSQSTANNLMQIHVEYSANSQALGNLSYTKAVALLGIEAEEREAFIREKDAENLSTRELQKVIKEKKQLEKELKKSEAAASTASEGQSELKVKITELEDELFRVQQVGNSNEEQEVEIARLSDELTKHRDRVKQLEQDLKEKPIEAVTATEIVEVIPEAVKEELDSTKHELEILRNKMYENTDPAEVRFKIRFESLISEFNSTLEATKQISNSDTKTKYSKAIVGLINKMKTTLEQEYVD